MSDLREPRLDRRRPVQYDLSWALRWLDAGLIARTEDAEHKRTRRKTGSHLLCGLCVGPPGVLFSVCTAANSDAARLPGTGAGVLLRLAFRERLPGLSGRDQRTVLPILPAILLPSLDGRGGHDSALRGRRM